MTFEQFQENIKAWSTQRGIYTHSTAKDQCLKAVSEMGELADNLIKSKDITDDLGDMIVCLINTAVLAGIELEDSFDHAWNEIKDRTGHMTKEGAFVKDE